MTKRVYQKCEHIKGHGRLLKELAIYPDSILKEKAVDFTDEELEAGKHKPIYEMMFEVMYHFGGIGLAANQARQSKRILIMDINEDNKYGVNDAFICTDTVTGSKIKPHKMVVINPEILEFSQETDRFEEGCLSLPDIRVNVTRPKTIKVKFLDENLNEKVYFMDGLLAKCMQHEIDHLDGILIVDKLPPETRRLCFESKLKQLAAMSRNFVESDA